MPDAIAVLTGDIVRSSALTARELDAAMAALSDGAAEAAAWHGSEARFTRFRGDGWQCLAPRSSAWLRTSLLLRARLRAVGRPFGTRVAVGIGDGDLGGGSDLAAASGAAFRTAGHLLDRMPRSRQMAVGWVEPPAEASLTGALLGLCDAISRRWTPAQAAALAPMLAPDAPVQAKVAESLQVSQQMIARHLQSAAERPLLEAVEAVEAAGYA